MSSREHHDVFFMHNGPPPWSCHFCGGPVEYRGPRRYAVHHLNHDHHDNRPENLVAAHDRCHHSHHSQQMWAARSPEERSELANRALPPNRRSEYARRALHNRWHVRGGKPCNCKEATA